MFPRGWTAIRELLFSGLALAVIFVLVSTLGRAEGVTIITHGQLGNVSGWISGMAASILSYPGYPGTNLVTYDFVVTYSSPAGYVVTPRKVAGAAFTNDLGGEIVVRLDWSSLAGFTPYSTFDVASAVVPALLQTNFIAELRGHALAELPIHLIGHSRGGSLMCEMAKLLGMQGVWVDHVTTLDPHPVNNDGNFDPLVSTTDAPLGAYENVLFADNYFQTFGGYPHGQSMPTTYNRQFTALPGGYSSAHSDVHLWYHATIDTVPPISDTEASLADSDRSSWFAPAEALGTVTGFRYTRIGRGNRISPAQPAGANSDQVRRGYSQRWDFGLGAANNRTPLPSNNGAWPSIMVASLPGLTNPIVFDASAEMFVISQFARPSASNATVSLFLDSDYNPFSGNERLLRQFNVAGTTSSNVRYDSFPFAIDPTNAPPGFYFVFAKITAEGRSRYLYAFELLQLISSYEPPSLAIQSRSANSSQITVLGIPGQILSLERSLDLVTWQYVASTLLQTTEWPYFDQLPPGTARAFYRARIGLTPLPYPY